MFKASQNGILMLILVSHAVFAAPPRLNVAFDEGGIYVYQAFNARTANLAVTHQMFVPGNGFKLSRMSWLKTSLGWMIHRSNFARASNQERILRIKISHAFFEELIMVGEMAQVPGGSPTRRVSDVLLQWDPDRDLNAQKTPGHTLQIGVRGELLCRYAREEILGIVDVTRTVPLDASSNVPLMVKPRAYEFRSPICEDALKIKSVTAK